MNREDLAKLYEKANGWNPAAFQITMEELERFAALVASDEREACAKIVELEAAQYAEPVWAVEIVNDIRARGQ